VRDPLDPAHENVDTIRSAPKRLLQSHKGNAPSNVSIRVPKDCFSVKKCAAHTNQQNGLQLVPAHRK
jgi:hypothetical protein